MPSKPARERKYFLCSGQCVLAQDLRNYPDSHVLGDLRVVMDEGEKVTALAVYERPVSTQQAFNPEIMAIRVWLIGDARGLRCALCGHGGRERRQRWELGTSGYKALVKRRSGIVV